MYTIREGYAPFRQYQTWFRICGNIDSGLTPLVVAHGGPGCTHDYVDAFRDIALSGRAVIHYDQLGNGRSTHLPQQPADFWQPALFLDELDNLLRHLNIADNYALLGQSWGGMLGAEHAVTQPKGLKALVIANSPASMALWLQGRQSCGRSCPPISSKRCCSTRPPGRWTARNIRRQASLLSTPRLSA
jgi:L-proline amide hydrolase